MRPSGRMPRKPTLLPWSRAPLTPLDRVYFDKGFFPALAVGEKETVPQVTPERRQAVSVTIENSYDDWCAAELAKALGKRDDAAYFTRLALNYQIVFNPAIDFMAPRDSEGNWVEPFDPKLGGGQGGRDYFTEVDSWLYTFGVQHDVARLIHLFGGRDAFNDKARPSVRRTVRHVESGTSWISFPMRLASSDSTPKATSLAFISLISTIFHGTAVEDAVPCTAIDGYLVWDGTARHSRRR